MRATVLPPPGLPSDPGTVAELLTALEATATAPESSIWTAYDTPDGRLAAAGMALLRRGRTLSLQRFGEWAARSAVASLNVQEEPSRQVAQWPAGALREALVPLVKTRAVLPCLTCRVERHSAVRCDELGKTVSRLEAWLVAPDQGGHRLWLTIDGLRGYARAYDATVAAMLDRGWREAGADPLTALIRAALPDHHSHAAPDFPDSAAPAGRALRGLLAQVVARLPPLEAGVVADVDSEFLHQHRVLLRRLRSLTAQFAAVFAPDDAVRIRTILKGWARCSNEVRDLDVWLLARDEHAALIPEALRPGLDALFAAIASDRAAAQAKLAERFASPGQLSEREALLTLVQSAPPGPEADVPLVALARRRTWKAYRRAASEGALINADTPSEIVHEVRIRCKKLRYLLDACGAAMAPDDHEELRSQLRIVQGVLGAFNDGAVQAAALLDRVQRLDHSHGPATQLAVGALLSALDRARRDQTGRLLLGLADLAAPATRGRYRKLFRSMKETRP